MGIKKYLDKTKLVNTIGLLILGFVVGLTVMYIYFQPKLANQEKISSENKTLASQNKKEALSYKEQLASASAEIKTLLNKPPEVIYKTQYVETQAQQNNDTSNAAFCYPDGSGGEWCRTSGGNTQHCMYYGTIRKCN